MAGSIKEVFASELKHLKIDNKLVKTIHKFERFFVNRSEDHITFLGGVLLGTPPLRFHSNDRNSWFDEVLEVDDQVLQNELHDLKTIDPTRKVSSDVFNISCVWLLHAIATSSSLSGKQKHQGMIDVIKILHYRWLSSQMAHNFKYEPDKSVAEATYAALSYKFALKVNGSWAALIEARAEDIVSKNSIHYNTIHRFDVDEDILYLITDTQGRIREIVKKMMRVFYEVKDSSSRITSSSSIVDLQGELHVRDLTRKTSQLKRYGHTVMVDKSTLIRTELVKIISDIMHTMPDRHLISSLEYMSNNYGKRGDPNIAKLIDETLLHAFVFINENKNEFRSGLNLSVLISRLRALYMSSRSSDPTLLKMRELSLGIVKKAVDSSNISLLASIRTGVTLYIVLRTFTMNYYTQGGTLEEIDSTLENTVF